MQTSQGALGEEKCPSKHLCKHIWQQYESRQFTSTHPDTAIHCYSESLRISRLSFGQNHTTVASAMFDLGNLYDTSENFANAMHYYERALSVYRHKYSQELTRQLCSGSRRQTDLTIGAEGAEFLSTGDEFLPALLLLHINLEISTHA